MLIVYLEFQFGFLYLNAIVSDMRFPAGEVGGTHRLAYESMLEKEGDKYYWTIDKQKELEAELRSAKAAQMPEQIAPLWQSYLLWEETKTPTHKWRAIKDALTLVENMTWVSAEDYYWTILRAENKDVPEVNDKSPVTSTVQNLNWQKQSPFMSL